MSDKVVTLLVELEQNCKNASRLCLSQIETLEKDIGYIQFCNSNFKIAFSNTIICRSILAGVQSSQLKICKIEKFQGC